MVARAPVVNLVECADGHRRGDRSGREDVVELPGRSRRSLRARVVGRHRGAVGRELGRPRIGLAPTAGCPGAEVGEAERFGAIEHGLIAAPGNGVAVFAVPKEQVEVAGDEQSVVAAREQRGEVGEDAMC